MENAIELFTNGEKWPTWRSEEVKLNIDGPNKQKPTNNRCIFNFKFFIE